MARNMSFMLTTDQVRNGTKTVTRRMGWWNLKPDTVLNACVQCQGLKLGQRVEVIRQIRVVNTTHTRLDRITPADMIREGFPRLSRAAFVEMFCKSHKGCTPDTIVNRIEFEYVD